MASAALVDATFGHVRHRNHWIAPNLSTPLFLAAPAIAAGYHVTWATAAGDHAQEFAPDCSPGSNFHWRCQSRLRLLIGICVFDRDDD